MRNVLVIALFAFASVSAAPAADVGYSADYNALLSKLQSMGHGSFPEAQWEEVFRQIQAISDRAEQAGDLDQVIDVNVVKAMVYSDMLKDYSAALTVLDDLKKRFGAQRVPAMKKVYVKEADIYGKLGDESAVRGVIDEFKRSAYYDPENYPFSGGQGREVPLQMVRPSATAADSLSVTAMEVARTQAHFAPGNYFPEFSVTDQDGATHTLADYRGKVLLVDFWLRDWTPWRRDLQNLASAYERHHEKGFDVLGLCLERNPEDLAGFFKQNKMTWPQVVDDAMLAPKLGIFGEATNFLLDRNGAIIGRDLHGADLVEAIKAALAAE